LISTGIASALLLLALALPLWRLELVAPQYPAGLVMKAYGYKFAGDPSTYYDDVREINGLNHYIGMAPIEEVLEMQLFIPGVIALLVATAVAGFVAWHGKVVRALVIAGYWFMLLFFVADLQFWLYHYGHTMDEEAALNPGAFTPKVFGTTKVWNFHSETRFELGFYLMVLAALVITLGPPLISRGVRLASRLREERASRHVSQLGARAAAVLLAMTGIALAGVLVGPSTDAAAAAGPTLQERIDNAAPDDIIVVEGGVYEERVHIDKPISLVGRDRPVVDGGGQGDVVTISADDVVMSGFEVRNSGRAVSQEPAAIKVSDADNVKISHNRIRASHFGVHVTGATGAQIVENDIEVGAGVPQERRGHAIYLWDVTGSTVHRNIVRQAADGIHLEFADDNLIVENDVRESRYALHLMYANKNSIVRNVLEDNLSGAVLMFSHELVVKDNEMSSNRKGATGAGMLVKDADNIYVEGNRLLRNKHGMSIEGAPQSVGATAIFRENLLALNDVGIAISSNSPITFVENAMIDNIVQVRAMSGVNRTLDGHGGMQAAAGDALGSGELPSGAVWSSSGRGNYWSDYRGFDSDGDGVGDQPYRPRPAFAGALAGDEELQLFQFTPAQQAIDLGADMFPVYRYEAVIEDGHPLMTPPVATIGSSGGVSAPLLAASMAMVAAAAAGVLGVYHEAVRSAWQRAGWRTRGLPVAQGS
jgi:nitrous oxidase accessory protein